MNDILARYQEIKDKAHDPYSSLELECVGNRILLHAGRRNVVGTLGCITVLLLFFSGMFYHVGAVALSVCALGMMALVAYPYLKYGLNPPSCILDTERQELLIYPYRAPVQTLALQDIRCFVSLGYRLDPTSRNSSTERSLYAVNQRGRMFRLVVPFQADDVSRRVLDQLGYLCAKPVYQAGKGMPVSAFMPNHWKNEAFWVFDVEKFLEAQKARHSANGNIEPPKG